MHFKIQHSYGRASARKIFALIFLIGRLNARETPNLSVNGSIVNVNVSPKFITLLVHN